MEIANGMISVLNRFAREGKKLIVRGINYAGQEFEVCGQIVNEANTIWGIVNDTSGFGLYLGQQRHGLYGDIFVQMRTVPESGDDLLGSLYVKSVMDTDGNVILENLSFEGIKKRVADQVLHFDGYNSTYFSKEAQNLLNYIGKPINVYGDDCILQAVREFQTPRGNVIYVDCTVGLGCRSIDVGRNANGVRFDEKRYKKFAGTLNTIEEMD